jgi:hypothetical protein
MKNTSIQNAFKAFLAVTLFSLGFAKAAAHIDPSHQAKMVQSVDQTRPVPPTMDH